MNTKNQKVLYGAIAALAALLTSSLMANHFAKRNALNSNEALNKMASEINKSLPMMVDAETQLTSVVGANSTILYHYKLVRLASADDPSLIDRILAMKQGMIQRNCTTPETRKEVLDKGITMSYRYYDKNSLHLTDIDINPKDCENL